MGKSYTPGEVIKCFDSTAGDTIAGSPTDNISSIQVPFKSRQLLGVFLNYTQGTAGSNATTITLRFLNPLDSNAAYTFQQLPGSNIAINITSGAGKRYFPFYDTADDLRIDSRVPLLGTFGLILAGAAGSGVACEMWAALAETR